MCNNSKLYLGLTDNGGTSERVYLSLSHANRHGLIAGASGTGKTITMKVMAESFSAAGVPVFLCDVKGDVSGICAPGEDGAGMQKRIDRFGIRETFRFRAYPTVFYDVYGQKGHPVRTTISDLGPSLLARILGLTEIQEGVLNAVFQIADDHDLMLIDMKDLRAVLQYVTEHRTEYTAEYGNMAPQSLGAITRALLPLESEGGDVFFGEPALDIHDWLRIAPDGRGYVNVLHCAQLIRSPKLYAAFLLWMLAELFEVLPEVGDLEKPRLVFFFDEAHTLFTDAPKALVARIEQTVKLIRSKGVGIYFVTQSPADIPNPVLAQLSNRVQHALRAYTPTEQKAIRAAAQSFRPNPAFRAEDEILNLGTGIALTSFLDDDGIPQIVEKTAILCPESRMAPATEGEMADCMHSSPVLGKYDRVVDNVSAYELLEKQAKEDAVRAEWEAERAALEAEKEKLQKEKEKAEIAAAKKAEREEEKKRAAKERKAERRKSKIESQLIQAGGQVLKRGLLGILKRM